MVRKSNMRDRESYNTVGGIELGNNQFSIAEIRERTI
jgi:hypothetical protein